MTKAVHLITAKPGGNSTHRKPRICKGCKRPILSGEKCLKYQRASHANYHCLECARKYNPVVLGEEIYFP